MGITYNNKSTYNKTNNKFKMVYKKILLGKKYKYNKEIMIKI